MIITFHGQDFIKLQAGSTIIACNPRAQEKGKKISRFGSDVVLTSEITSGVDEMFESASYNDKAPIALYGAGSYEVGGRAFEAFETTSDETPQIVYWFNFDDMNCLWIGRTSNRHVLPPELLEKIEDLDMLFMSAPKGDDGAPDHAHSLITSLAPKCVVLTGFEKDEKEIKTFLDSQSGEFLKEGKLTLKAKDLSETGTRVVAIAVA